MALHKITLGQCDPSAQFYSRNPEQSCTMPMYGNNTNIMKACCDGHPIIPYTHPLDEPGTTLAEELGANWATKEPTIGSTADINLNKTMESAPKNETTEESSIKNNGTALDSNTPNNGTSDHLDEIPVCSGSAPFYISGTANSCSMPVCGNNSAIVQYRCRDNPVVPYSADGKKLPYHLCEGSHCSMGNMTIDDWMSCVEFTGAVRPWSCSWPDNSTTDDTGAKSNETTDDFSAANNGTTENPGVARYPGGWKSVAMGYSMMGLLLSVVVAL
ncbi:hypothetical protein D6D01_00596 [Aureobasidium pullulans]|uniref:Uncharacterized protein n=1 Tax=Aureobasidium pullulans TaxID=5580 RepID=A0A4S9M1I9_AURPU|nr:hypothetical protein D6D01_00596 [Aureobasidium pullulans]